VNYSALASTAQRLIQDAGRTITIKRYAPSRNGSTGLVVKGSATLTATPYVVELPAAKGLRMFESQIKAESLVIQQLRFFVIEAVGQTFAPLPQDEAEIDGAAWPIKGVNGCTPATVPLTYNIMVAK
jgi:hypothetical protein